MIKLWLSLVGLSGFLAVGLGAFGAHGLKGKISESLLAAFQTASHYQMFHTLALFALVVAMMVLSSNQLPLLSSQASIPKALPLAAFLWFAGMLLFCGSLYGLAMGGPRWLGPVTPLGGLLLMAGWISLAVGAWQLRL
jgi:uncharacterized membrane protein YgdD (TMEM256/DUF423 family)